MKKKRFTLCEVVLYTIITSLTFSVGKTAYDYDPANETANQQHLHLEDFRLTEERMYNKNVEWDYDTWIKENEAILKDDL